MSARGLILLTAAAFGLLAAAALAEPPAPPTTRPAAPDAAAPAPAPRPQTPAPTVLSTEEFRRKVLRFGPMIPRDPKIIQENARRWSEMTPAQKQDALNRMRQMFTYMPEDKLIKLWKVQEEFRSLDPQTQQRYRKYALQVHDLVQSLPAHTRAQLNAMTDDARKKELARIVKEMQLRGEWPPKPAADAEPTGSG